MSDEPADDSPTGARTRLPTSRVRFAEFFEHSVGAVVMVCGLFTLLGYMYFAGTSDPEAHMRHFPVAVVNLDTGATLDTPIGPQHLALGQDVIGGMMDNNDWSKLDLRIVSDANAQTGLHDGRYYGLVTIPADFSQKVAALMNATTGSGRPPGFAQIGVASSPRVSIAAAPVMQRLSDGVQSSLDRKMGPQILAKTRLLAQARGSGEVSPAAATAIASPIRVVTGTWNPLPPGVTNATLPMFYALIIILAGFTGAMVISNLMDARLGFMPLEVGPFSMTVEVTGHGRLRVLLRKWLVTLFTAPLVAAIYIGLAHRLGMEQFSYWNSFWFSTLGIIAVGVCTHTILMALGGLGMLVNLVVFVVLGIPTSGGTTPPEMLPTLFQVIGEIEPMHQVYIGIRAIMFFDSSSAAGVDHAVWVLLAWAAGGVLSGMAIAALYDRSGLRRQLLDQRLPAAAFQKLGKDARAHLMQDL